MPKLSEPCNQLPDNINDSSCSNETDLLLYRSYSSSSGEVGLVPRLLPLLVGCLGMIVAGSIFSFGDYSNAVKKQFSYTQSQVEVMASLGNFGISMGLPAGMMCERFGARWTSFVTLLVSTTSMMLLWSTTFYEEFYNKHASLQYLYFFFAGFGAIFMYMASMITGISNFHPKHRGKVVGTLDACFSGGPTLFSLLYGSCFVKDEDDEENQDLRGFYLLNAISFAAIGLLGVLLLKTHPVFLHDFDLSTSHEYEIRKAHNHRTKDITGCALIRRSDFHFILWPFMFCSGLQLMYQDNISVYLKSFNLERYTTLCTTLNPTAAILCKFCVGLISDAIVHEVPRPAILLFFCCLQTLVLTLCIFFANNFFVLLITLIVIGFANGCIWCLSPTIISEVYGIKYFGRNWGTAMIGSAIGGLGCQQMFGVLYDYSIGLDGVVDCYGIKCFKLSFTVVATVSFCSCLLCLGLMKTVRKEKNKSINITP